MINLPAMILVFRGMLLLIRGASESAKVNPAGISAAAGVIFFSFIGPDA